MRPMRVTPIHRRAVRVALCAATKKVLASGLDLLGIQAPERM